MVKKEIKRILSVSVTSELFDWLKNQDINVSEYINRFLEEEYENKDDPIRKIKRYNQELSNNQEKLDFYYDKLLKIVEDGNKKEREEASILKKTKQEKEKKDIERNVNLIELLRNIPDWVSFIEKERDIDYIGNWYEENILSKDMELHRKIGGIGVIVALLKKFSKEQLKGSVILTNG